MRFFEFMSAILIFMTLSSNVLSDEVSMIEVTSIKFKGVDKLDEDELIDVMNLKRGKSYKEYIFNYLKDRDADLISDKYRDEGFMKADVVIGVSLEGKGKSGLLVQVNEGERCKVELVDVLGIEDPEQKKEIIKKAKISDGDYFTEALINDAEQNIFQYFAEDGYIYADIRTEIKFNEDYDTAFITYQIDRGKKAYFGNVEVAGNIDTRPKIVLRELKFKKGEIYRPSKVLESKEEIYETGLYKDVSFKIQDYENQPEVVDILILVKESKQKWFEVNPGYESPDRLILDLGWGHENIFGDNQRLSITGGIKYGLISEEAEERVVVGYQEPWLFGWNVTGTANFYIENYTYKSYAYWKIGTTVEVEKEFTKKITGIQGLEIESVGYDRKSDSTNRDLEDEITDDRINSASIKTSIIYDSRDNPFNPLDGAYSYFSGEYAGGFLPGDNDFVKGILEMNRYMNISESGVFALHLRLGSISTFGQTQDVPIYERFFAGGAYSVRGYGYRKLGPLNAEGDPLGGELLFESGVEMRVQIPFFDGVKIPWIGLDLSNLWGGIFLDMGNVFGKFYDFKWSKLEFGAGIGLRYNTPVGPIRFDYGRTLTGDEKEGHFYLALGHAF